MTHQPVFFDPSGQRRRWSLRGVVAAIVLIVVAAVLFATTVVNVPAGLPLALSLERPQPLRLAAQVARAKHRVRRGLASLGTWLPRSGPRFAGTPLTVGFYVPWDPASAESLRAHIDNLDWVVPALATVSGADQKLRIVNDTHLAILLDTAQSRPHQLTMVQNLSDGSWDGPGAAALLRQPAARARLIAELEAMTDRQHAAGVTFDFENLSAQAVADYVHLLDEAHRAFAAKGKLVAVTLPADDPTWPFAKIAAVTDRVFLMNYDQHWQGGTAGPIAAQPWFVDQLRSTLAKVPRDKLIVALGSYGYDWHGGSVDAMTVEEALSAAHDSSSPPTFDPESGNLSFGYQENGEDHAVWLMDAAATWNQLQAVRALGVSSVALWRLGSEDPGVWKALDTWRSGHGKPDLGTITPVSDVDVEGSGEILRITDTPHTGVRHMDFASNGLIRNVSYQTLPTPYVVSRTGAKPKLVALTFDDGPDADWTPKILDILDSRHVPGTFFVIGENAVQNEGLMRRIAAEGHEIGNHSYTHPNLANVPDAEVRIELNATQRVVEAYTGRSTRLFRAPYFGDAEPTTADEIGPALIAQQAGYTVVGLHVDPADWKRPGVDAIVNTTIDEVTHPDADRASNIVLLHDGGGNREQTVAALPRIIDGLRAQGYSFVPVSALAGLPHDVVMPRVTPSDQAAVRFDVGIFQMLAAIQSGLVWLFFLAIALGMGRAVLMTVLAVAGRNRMPAPSMPETPPRVSVIIPAYNEERVIETSVRRVLDSEGADIEVIVADDGSHDRTSEIVTRVFGDDPRVRLLTLVNGGKAAALNRALELATAPIIVALDADTQFEPLTIARLARWFDDPDVGGVAGNAKVGNRVNLVTRWQAVEYVTAQNVERRALARFDAMMVIPGAVGAWRREALDDVGGYPTDTLAEDQDLTIAIQRNGWRVAYDVDAVAWTESPETFKALAKQRYRWAFGTLQCLWKHGRIVLDRNPAGLALIGVPQTWLFQILFAAVSPLIDLALLVSIGGTLLRVWQHGWAQTQTDVFRMGIYWLLFTGVDLACGWTAYRLEKREVRFPGFLLLAQRFVYRQVMYWVVLRAISSAIAGFWVGWGKLERTGRTTATG